MSTEVAGPDGSALSEGLGPTPPDDEHPYTYASTQATNCAGCGEYKHTPLRIDAMGGYVCLTCIDRKLGTLLGEFGYPAPQQPLTRQQIDDVMTQHYPLSSLLREEVDAFEACVRDLERLHGIGAQRGVQRRGQAQLDRFRWNAGLCIWGQE